MLSSKIITKISDLVCYGECDKYYFMSRSLRQSSPRTILSPINP